MSRIYISTDDDGLVWTSRPNQSLTHGGRVLWVGLIGLNAMVISVFAWAIGAWPVVPFAGLEVLLVATAFWLVSRHDEDSESFQIRGSTFSWFRRYGRRVEVLSGNLEWAWLGPGSERGRPCTLLRYAGQAVRIGMNWKASDQVRFRHAVGRQRAGISGALTQRDSDRLQPEGAPLVAACSIDKSCRN